MNFFTSIATVCFTTENTCTCMHTIQDVRSREYTQPPPLGVRGRLHGSNVLTYILYVHAVSGRVHGGWALFRAFTVCFNFQAAASPCWFMPLALYSSRYLCDDRILPETRMSWKLCSVFHNPSFMLDSITTNKIQYKLD